MFAFCTNCLGYRDGYRITREVQHKVRRVTFTYQETVLVCRACGTEIYHHGLNDANCRARLESFWKAKGEK